MKKPGNPSGLPRIGIEWGLDWLEEDPARLALVVRPSSVVSVFGTAVKGFETDPDKAALAIARIRQVTPAWIAGNPLNDIEQIITSKNTGKCDSAREWALRFVPELAYYFGLTVQVFLRRRLAIEGHEPNMPLVFAQHGRCFREGFDHPEKLALRQVVGTLIPRVLIHRKYAELERFLDQGTQYESLDDAKGRVRKALRRQQNQ